jgi:hypothetical protein
MSSGVKVSEEIAAMILCWPLGVLWLILMYIHFTVDNEVKEYKVIQNASLTNETADF